MKNWDYGGENERRRTKEKTTDKKLPIQEMLEVEQIRGISEVEPNTIRRVGAVDSLWVIVRKSSGTTKLMDLRGRVTSSTIGED